MKLRRIRWKGRRSKTYDCRCYVWTHYNVRGCTFWDKSWEIV